MRIGISFVGTDSVFDAGTAQATFAIAGACKQAGHEVVLIGTLWPNAPKGLYASLSAELLPSLSPQLDLLIDMEGRTGLSSAAMVVALLRSDPSRVALEQAAYLSQEPPVDLSHVHQVWVWDMVSEERLPLIEQLLQKPVRRVPYVWTPLLLQQFVRPVRDIKAPYKVFLASKNTTTADSCLVPLIGVCANPFVQSIVIGNGLDLPTSAYFQMNIAPSLDKLVEYVGRIPYVDLSGVLVVCNGGFTPGLLDLLWLDQPLVHNCPLFKSFGGYYEGNDLVLSTLEPSTSAKEAVEAFGSRSWDKVFEKEERAVIFTDMWEGFQSSENFFLDLMNSVDPVYKWIGSVEGSLLICGPFGNEWQQSRYASVPKVFFLGEPFENRITDPRLHLVLSHDPVEDATHMRLPLWPLFLDWFGSKNNKNNNNNNPNQLPLHYALTPFKNTNREFCAFVVSNPGCVARNEAFDQLNAYKRVNSGGLYKNNVGGSIFCKFGGGGGGDQAKFEFLKNHQFCICYENTQQPGYVTEKLLHAKLAGCVPLYWGSKC
jgi:hypothetical protein